MKEQAAGGGGKADLDAFSGLPDDEWVPGVVKSLVNFGAFVEVKEPGGDKAAQGLVHISQIKDGIVDDPGEELEVDQEVKVRVISVDVAGGKLSLSMREKAPAPA